jgi:multisubunit Na+/H+ antiporter MnhC subunit
MHLHEDQSLGGSKSSNQRRNLGLFYFETIAGRTYLRFTRSAIILILGLTAISVGSILVIFVMSSQQSATEPVNVNVTTPTQAPPSLSNKHILRQPLPQSQPPKVAQPVYSMPTPLNTQPLNKNFNSQTILKRTPQTPPSEYPP